MDDIKRRYRGIGAFGRSRLLPMSHEVGRKQSARQTVFARRAIWLALTSSRALIFELTSHVSRSYLILSSWFILITPASVSLLSFVLRPVRTHCLNYRAVRFSIRKLDSAFFCDVHGINEQLQDDACLGLPHRPVVFDGS